MHRLFKDGNMEQFVASARYLGLPAADFEYFRKSSIPAMTEPINVMVANTVNDLIGARAKAKSERNFSEADRIRDGLLGAGIRVTDRKDGTSGWELVADFDPAKLEALK